MNKLDVYDISIEELVCLLSSFFMYLSPTALFSLISLVLFTFLCFHTCTFICDVLLPCSFIPYQDLWAFGLLSFLSHLQVKTATNSSVFPFSSFSTWAFFGPCCQLWVHISQLFPLPTKALFSWLERHNCLAFCYHFTKSWIYKLLFDLRDCLHVCLSQYQNAHSCESELTLIKEMVREPLIKW